MLVGRSLVDGIGTVGAANLGQPQPIDHRAQQSDKLHLQVTGQAQTLQRLMNFVQAELAVIRQEKLARLFGHDLPVQLSANIPPHARDQHHFFSQVAC